MTDAGGAAGGSADDPEPHADELLHFAKQRKRDANARHRARKKAVQADPASWQQDMERQLEVERRRLAELQSDEAALNSMAAYQHEAMQVLEFANFAERVGGEVTFLGTGAAAAAATAGPAITDDDGLATAAAVETAKDGKDWVALFAATLVPTEKVEASVGSVGERHAGTARAAQQAAAWRAAAHAQASAAAEAGETEEEEGYVSSRSGSGGSSGSGGRGGPSSGAPAAGPAGQAAATATAVTATAVPVSPVAHSSHSGAAGRSAQHAEAGRTARERAFAAAAAAAADMDSSQPRSSGGATRGSRHAQSSGQQAPADANEFLEKMQLGAADRGLMDLLMQEQRVIKHWYFAGSATVRASIVRLACMALSVLPVSVISQRNKAYMCQLQHTVQRWEACPGSRRQIEEILAARFVDRQVLMRHLAHNRPKALLEVWAGVTCPPAPPGTPSIGGRPPLHPMLLPIAQYLDAILTPDKLAQLEVDWHKYQQAMGATIELRVQASARLQYAAAVQAVSWQKQSMLPKGGSTAERSQAYCTMAESSGCLATLETRELIALLDLQEALMRVLTPIQMARVFMGCFPYNPDMTRICPWLFTKPPPPQQQLPPAAVTAGHFIAPMPAQASFMMLGQEFRPAVPLQAVPQAVPFQAVPAGSQVPAGSPLWGVVPVGAADVALSGGGLSGAACGHLPGAAFAPAGLAAAAPGNHPTNDPEALLDLLNDDELDLLIADLGGEDVGHLLAATSPRLP